MDGDFDDALAGLKRGDFSRLAPLFAGGGSSRIAQWLDEGQLQRDPAAMAEALTCASFLGEVEVAKRLLAEGVPPTGGQGTGLNALHWAVNRGQLDAVRLLVARGADLETRSMYDGTALGTAYHAAEHEPRPDHSAIIAFLLESGAKPG